jgi:6-phosphogluconate dehydrogenase
MQLIAETYDIMRSGLQMSAPEIGEVFASWRQGVLSSYLIDITADIFKVKDPDTGNFLVDMILDKAGQKGTGKWTSQDALDIGAPIPTINAAVEGRILSSYKEERLYATKILRGPKTMFKGDRAKFLEHLHSALYASKIISYAQGMALLKAASDEYGFDLRLWELARIWKGGCIIRAKLLDAIMKAMKKKPANLMLAPFFRRILNRNQRSLRRVVQTGQKLGVPCLAMAASLAYYDSYRKESLPANLTQAQRDYFGAHTYQRIDKEGTFHTEWTKLV